MSPGQGRVNPFARPLAGRVDPDLAPPPRHPARVVERLRRPLHELHVALGVDVAEGAPGDLGGVLHVHVGVHHDDDLGERRLPQPPDPVHHLARVLRVALVDRHDHEVVEHALERHVVVHDLREHLPHQRQEHPLDRVPHVAVLHRRPADDGGRVDRVLAVRDRRDVEHRVVVGERVEPGVVAERPLAAPLVGVDPPLEHELGAGRHLEVHGDAAHHLHRLAAHEPREQHLVDPRRQRHRRREHRRGIAAERHRDLGAPSLPARVLEDARRVVVEVPVHPRGVAVVDLQAVHPAVAPAARRVLGDHVGEREEAAAVLGPALQDWECAEVHLVALLDDLVHRPVLDDLGEDAGDLGELRQRLDLVEQRGRRLRLEEEVEAIGPRLPRLDLERPHHPGDGAEQVDRHGHRRALDALEQQRRPLLLDDAVGDLGDLEDRRHLGADASELACLFQRLEVVAQVAERHGRLRCPALSHGHALESGQHRARRRVRDATGRPRRPPVSWVARPGWRLRAGASPAPTLGGPSASC